MKILTDKDGVRRLWENKNHSEDKTMMVFWWMLRYVKLPVIST